MYKNTNYIVIANVRQPTHCRWVISSAPVTTTTFSLSWIDPQTNNAPSTTSAGINWIAIGRWK